MRNAIGYESHFIAVLRMNVSKDQSRYKQGSANRADFHIYGSVFNADHRGAVRFSEKLSYTGLR